MFIINQIKNIKIINISLRFKIVFIIIIFFSIKSLNKENMNDTLKFLKYQNMLPNLSINPFHPASSITEIFNARQLYISDISINQEFIRYIRNINEIEEQKYKNRFSENVTIDKTLFKQRIDQYDYKEFCSLSLKEKLIEDKKIKYNNKPIISIILPTYNKKTYC